MVLDEPKETDDVYKINGFTMLVDKELHEKTKDITVDYVSYGMGSGFRVASEMPVGGGGEGAAVRLRAVARSLILEKCKSAIGLSGACPDPGFAGMAMIRPIP